MCEQEFHNDNIKIISIKTECDYDVAKENYELCNYDVVKTVERINQKPIIITTGKATDSKIGFVLWPENGNGEFYKTAKRNVVPQNAALANGGRVILFTELKSRLQHCQWQVAVSGLYSVKQIK